MHARVHPLTGAPLEPIYVDRHGRTIWPILGGSEPAPETTPPAPPTGPPAPPAPPAAGDPGYPANTPVAEMTAEQQVAYWKSQSRKHEGRASERADYEAIKAERDQLKQQHMSAEEKALEEARTQAKAEGRAEALRDSTKGTVTALLDGALRIRGWSDDQVADALKYVNTDAFVTDGAPATKAILAYAETIAGPATGRTGPDFGAGHRGNSRADTGLSAGADMFAARRKSTTKTS